jgi:hypothetical protein
VSLSLICETFFYKGIGPDLKRNALKLRIFA